MVYELDVSKWRCGRESDNAMGNGHTQLLNMQGYMCCMGQFAAQKGVSNKSLFNKLNPEQIGYNYDDLFIKIDETGNITYTQCTPTLVCINDNINMTPIEKIEKIRAELEKHDHGLKVKNAHLLAKWKDN